MEGTPVRLSGQDSRRGTFSQRHSVLVDSRTGDHFVLLNVLGENQAPFSVYDSMLSEQAVLGFEYGYSLADPHSLVLWEAQFGDFANNAQVIIDQYISSAESKWQRRSGLVLLLPHGYEGQGAEHSSARLERYLQICADENIQVTYPTTPAQYFHVLRRQMRRPFRKPLIIMAPKSLLRHPMAVSNIEEFSRGHFMEVLDDPQNVGNPDRVLLCSGKIFYDLLERRSGLQRTNVAIVRLEQLYPFPRKQLQEALMPYTHAEKWMWVQEEPENMGSWNFVKSRLESLIGRRLTYVGRREAASPATGFLKVHKQEQAAIVNEAVE
jgi:2-oxoglutarate dehydrogenase E1 component